MLFGLTFSTTGGESLQFAFDTAGLNLFARATSGGVFGEWKFICGADGADGGGGSGGDTVTAERAEVANKAYKLAAPITIQFTGDVSGEATFDGSANVISNLTVRNGAGGGGGSTEVAEDMVRRIIKEELGTGRYPYKLIEAAIDASMRKHQLDWH